MTNLAESAFLKSWRSILINKIIIITHSSLLFLFVLEESLEQALAHVLFHVHLLLCQRVRLLLFLLHRLLLTHRHHLPHARQHHALLRLIELSFIRFFLPLLLHLLLLACLNSLHIFFDCFHLLYQSLFVCGHIMQDISIGLLDACLDL